MDQWIWIFFCLGICLGMLIGAGLVFLLDKYF